MNDIVNSTARNLKDSVSDNKPGLIEAMLEMTRDMTGPQAAVAIAGLGAFGAGLCYAIHEFSTLVKDGCIKSLDLGHKKIDFAQPNQAINV